MIGHFEVVTEPGNSRPRNSDLMESQLEVHAHSQPQSNWTAGNGELGSVLLIPDRHLIAR